MIRRILREPLLHFVALGTAIFGAYWLVAAPTQDNAVIVVTPDRIAALDAQFSAIHDGRPPTDLERRNLFDAYLRDEMLYREGLALGLDRDDPVVRNRVRQKADILSSDALAVEPTDADLEAYLKAHRSEFDIPGRVSFEQIYFDPARHAEPIDAVVARAQRALAGGLDASAVGDRTLLPATIARALPSDVTAQFGEGFAKQLADLNGKAWQGPVTTPFGVHLVRVTAREPATPATLANARDVVAREWSRAQIAARKEQFYRDLAKRYTIRVEAAPDHQTTAANGANR